MKVFNMNGKEPSINIKGILLGVFILAVCLYFALSLIVFTTLGMLVFTLFHSVYHDLPLTTTNI